MRIGPAFACLGIGLALAACSTPVALVLPRGHVLKGESARGAGGNPFQVTDGKLSCSGQDHVTTFGDGTVSLFCSDGRMRNGQGKDVGDPERTPVVFNDGTKGTFLRGAAASGR